MLFKVKRGDLFSNLQSSVAVIEKKQTMPILSNILLKTQDNSLIMTGTDLEIQLETRISAQVDRSGETSVSGRKFFDICRNLPEDATLQVELKDDHLHVQSGRTRFKLGTLSAKSFPEFTVDTYNVDLSIDERKLYKVLQSTGFCMATQDVRYYLNGLMMEIDRTKIGAVASNGHRLAMNSVELDHPSEITTQMILPKKGVTELIRLLSDKNDNSVRLKASESNIEVDLGDTVFLSKLIDGRYPDFKGALSQSLSHTFDLSTTDLRNALSRVSVLSHEKFRKITLVFSNGVLVIRTDNSENEQAVEEIDIDYQGEPYEISVNVSYLLEAINNLQSDRVHLSFTEETNICLLTVDDEPDLTYVVMPLA